MYNLVWTFQFNSQCVKAMIFLAHATSVLVSYIVLCLHIIPHVVFINLQDLFRQQYWSLGRFCEQTCSRPAADLQQTWWLLQNQHESLSEVESLLAFAVDDLFVVIVNCFESQVAQHKSALVPSSDVRLCHIVRSCGDHDGTCPPKSANVGIDFGAGRKRRPFAIKSVRRKWFVASVVVLSVWSH